MSNFSDYLNKEKNNNKSTSQKNDYSEKDLQNKIDEYSKYNLDRLLDEFTKLTIEKKKKGELRDNELTSLKNTIMPMLNKEQRDNLDRLLQMVKDVQ